tara:strand:- start:1220 stop:1375 length:156 start_codon:yes stop_codon:yes gene_type:complete
MLYTREVPYLYSRDSIYYFNRRIDTDYENFDEDEKYRAICLGIRSLRSMLD